MITDNHDNYNREDHNYRTAEQGITSETTEIKDPAVNQHQDDSNTRTHVETTDHLYREDSDEKNASANDDPDDNDRNRRTLDESEADEEESDVEE